jgi:hypothetical protein
MSSVVLHLDDAADTQLLIQPDKSNNIQKFQKKRKKFDSYSSTAENIKFYDICADRR